MTVTPGFIDTHSHPSGVNELYGVNTDLRTVAEIQAALRRKAVDTPPGRWVRGFMFDDTKVVDGPLHRTHLDAAVPDHPVNVAHRGGHTNWFNSTAFEAGRHHPRHPGPARRTLRARDADGGLSGMVAEHARDVFADVGEREELTEEERRTRAREGDGLHLAPDDRGRPHHRPRRRCEPRAGWSPTRTPARRARCGTASTPWSAGPTSISATPASARASATSGCASAA